MTPPEDPQFFIPEDSKPSHPPYDEDSEALEPITPHTEPPDGPPERKNSTIPKHLAALQDPPRSSKPLTPLQELLAVVNSTVENDSLGGGASEPESQPPLAEPHPAGKPLKPLARLKQGVEQYRKLAPGEKQKAQGGAWTKSKGPGLAPNLKKTKKGLFKGGKRTKGALPGGVSLAPGGGLTAPGDAPKTPLPKKESAAEIKKRVSQVAALLGREETPEEKRSHKKKIPLINIGERILIYWPMDGVFYSGEVLFNSLPSGWSYPACLFPSSSWRIQAGRKGSP